MSPAVVSEDLVNVECPQCQRWHATPESKALLPCWWCRRGLTMSPYTDGVDRAATISAKDSP